MSKGYQTLFIIDDCSAEGEINKKRDASSELAFSGRHSGLMFSITCTTLFVILFSGS